MSIKKTLIGQVIRKPFTNPFPTRHAPDSVKDLSKKGVKINPPVEVPDDFRGKVKYDRAKCIGCAMCVRVCPCNAMEYLPKEKKIKHHVIRCMMCAECVDVCPVKALSTSKEFLLSDFKKDSAQLIEK